MDYITILTPDNIELEYRLAGVGSRLAAATIDLAVQTIVLLIFASIFIFGVLKLNFSTLPNFNPEGWLIALAIIIFFLIYFGYYIISELATNGQSIGKRIFGLRVIRENGRPITLSQSLIRNLFRYFIDAFGPGILCVFFTKKCKRVGDMAASTIVVSENPLRIKSNELKLLNLQPYIRAENLDNLSLSDNELFWLKEYFGRKNSFPEFSQSHLENFLAYFAEKFGIPQNMLNEEILFKILQANYK